MICVFITCISVLYNLSLLTKFPSSSVGSMQSSLSLRLWIWSSRCTANKQEIQIPLISEQETRCSYSDDVVSAISVNVCNSETYNDGDVFSSNFLFVKANCKAGNRPCTGNVS